MNVKKHKFCKSNKAVLAPFFQDTLPRLHVANDTPAAHYTFCENELGVMRRLLLGEHVTLETSGLTPQAWRQLMYHLGRENISLVS